MTGPVPFPHDDSEIVATASTPSHRLTADIADCSSALRIAGALQDLVAPPPEAVSLFEERVSDGIASLWRIEAYFSGPQDGEALRVALEAMLGEAMPPFEAAPVPDLNWVAHSQAALPPVRAGKFTVYGSHDRARVPQGPNAILIEAGEAFGTAHHPTTLGCLMAIGTLARSRSFGRVLDLGCGSGILAIAAARALPGASIVAVDFDRRSVAVAEANAGINGVAARVGFVCAAGVTAPLVRQRAPFGLIVANILAGPLIALAPDLRRVGAPGGFVVLSGLLTREARPVIAAIRAQGFALTCHHRLDGWSTLTLRNRTVARATGRA